MNNTTILNEWNVHCYYAELTEFNYHHLIKLNNYINDSNRLAYSVNICYGTHLERSVLPTYMKDIIYKAIDYIKCLDQKYLIDYYTKVLKQTDNRYHIVRNASLFQRLFISLFYPTMEILENNFNVNNLDSDYTYYLIKLLAILPKQDNRLSKIMNILSDRTKIELKEQIENIYKTKNLKLNQLRYFFNKNLLMQEHLFRYFIVGYCIYQIRKNNFIPLNIKSLIPYLTSHGVESVITHACKILNEKYWPVERSLNPYA